MSFKVGDRVKVGDLIGWADNTGVSTGDHLHYEVKPVDELGNNVLRGNGFFGAIDPLPYLQNISAIGKASFRSRILLQLADLIVRIEDFLLRSAQKNN